MYVQFTIWYIVVAMILSVNGNLVVNIASVLGIFMYRSIIDNESTRNASKTWSLENGPSPIAVLVTFQGRAIQLQMCKPQDNFQKYLTGADDVKSAVRCPQFLC